MHYDIMAKYFVLRFFYYCWQNVYIHSSLQVFTLALLLINWVSTFNLEIYFYKIPKWYVLIPNFPTFKTDLAGNWTPRFKIFLYLKLNVLFEQEKRKYDNHKMHFLWLLGHNSQITISPFYKSTCEYYSIMFVLYIQKKINHEFTKNLLKN